MFDLANDRLSFGRLLRPDPGYTLDYAVGTTYSLDLEALLGVPVSLGLLDEVDEENFRNPLYILEAIRKSADRIAILCNAGGIKLPDKIQSVYSLLENSVFQVKMPEGGNFHPKVWVMKYSQDGGAAKIRVLVMSRNLTFDSSIDIAVSLTGEVGQSVNEKHRPLYDFLRYLAPWCGRKQQRILSIAEEVLRVDRFEVCHPFMDYDFFPIGVPEYPGDRHPLFGKKSRLFAVSPFISDSTVAAMTRFTGDRTLVTRKTSVTPSLMEAFQDSVYVTKDILSDNEYGAKQDIHAKMYYVTTNECNYLYLGSANASHNAFHRNVEFLIRFSYKPYTMGYKVFFGDFLAADNCPYEKLDSIPEIPPVNHRDEIIDAALREAVYALTRATVTATETGYTLEIRAKPLKTDIQVRIAPIQRAQRKQPLESRVIFPDMLLKELSEFYVLEAEGHRLVVKLATSGIPKDRDQEIYRNIINSRAKFMSYLSFVLSGDLAGESGSADDLQSSLLRAESGSGTSRSYSAVYEQMLQVFHQDPARIKSVSDMMKRLDPEVIGEEFIRMYRQFETAARKIKR